MTLVVVATAAAAAAAAVLTIMTILVIKHWIPVKIALCHYSLVYNLSSSLFNVTIRTILKIIVVMMIA